MVLAALECPAAAAPVLQGRRQGPAAPCAPGSAPPAPTVLSRVRGPEACSQRQLTPCTLVPGREPHLAFLATT